jgi:hypothetical protein
MNPALCIWHPLNRSALDLPPVHVEHAQGAYLYAKARRKTAATVSSCWGTCTGVRIRPSRKHNRGSHGEAVLRMANGLLSPTPMERSVLPPWRETFSDEESFCHPF